MFLDQHLLFFLEQLPYQLIKALNQPLEWEGNDCLIGVFFLQQQFQFRKNVYIMYANFRDIPLERPVSVPTNACHHHKWRWLCFGSYLSVPIYFIAVELRAPWSVVQSESDCGVFSILARSSLCFSWYHFHCPVSQNPVFLYSFDHAVRSHGFRTWIKVKISRLKRTEFRISVCACIKLTKSD